MAKAPKSKPADSTQDSEKFAESHQPEVLSRLERLHAELAKETGDASSLGGNIHDKFTTEALSKFADLVKQISGDDRLPRKHRMQLLAKIQNSAAQEEKSLELPLPLSAPILWVDREDKEENPFIFCHRVYGEVAQFMLISDFTRLDPTLGAILDRHKREEKHIPKGFDILSKKERDAGLISNPMTWAEYVDSLPPHQRPVARAVAAAGSNRSAAKKLTSK